MRQERRSRSLTECIIFSSTRRIRLTLVSVALIMLSGCATNQLTEYMPLIRGAFSARTQPAKVSKESENSMIKSGYVKIGYVKAVVADERCDGDLSKDINWAWRDSKACERVSGAPDATAAALEKAAAHGGDAVVVRDETTGRAVNYAGDYTGTVSYTSSWGIVWRYDPDQSEVVKTLLSGAELNAQDENGKTALIIAAEAAPIDVVKTLLTRGADVNAKDKADNTALVKAAEGGHPDVVKMLLASGAIVKGRYGSAALIRAAKGGHVEVVKALFAYGADLSGENRNYSLILAAEGGYAEVVKILLARGANVNAKNSNGETALIKAAQGGHAGAVKALLAYGPEVNVKSKDGKTALWLAAKGGHAEIVKDLAARGADVNTKAFDIIRTKTALMVAADWHHPEVVKVLLAHGAEVNAKDTSNSTALTHAATWSFNTDVVKLLVAGGADVNARDTNGYTALTYLQRNLRYADSKEVQAKLTEVIELLKKAGAKE